jgi:hypothetical protein
VSGYELDLLDIWAQRAWDSACEALMVACDFAERHDMPPSRFIQTHEARFQEMKRVCDEECGFW